MKEYNLIGKFIAESEVYANKILKIFTDAGFTVITKDSYPKNLIVLQEVNSDILEDVCGTDIIINGMACTLDELFQSQSIDSECTNMVDDFEDCGHCTNDEVYCKCRSCKRNEVNGGACIHCLECIDGEAIMDTCPND